MNDLGDHQVVQRTIGSASGAVSITGSYTGTPDHIEAQVEAFGGGQVMVPWAVIDPAPSGGNFAESLPVPQGGWYQIDVRTCDASENVLASSTGTRAWGVGINILCIGDGNMAGSGDSSYTLAQDQIGLLSQGATWKHLADPWISGAKASMGPALGNALNTAVNLPIGLLPVASSAYTLVNLGGSGAQAFSYRNPANPMDPSTAYGLAIAAAITAGGVEYVAFCEGDAEAQAGSVSAAQYVAAFQTMCSNLAGDLPQAGAVHVCLSQTGRFQGAGEVSMPDTTRFGRPRSPWITPPPSSWSAAPWIWPSLVAAAPSRARQRRHWAAASPAPRLFDLGQAPTYGSPNISQATLLNATTVQVSVLQHGGSDFTPVTGIPGFVVTDAAGAHVVTGARVDGTTINLTGTGSFTGTIQLTYLEGANPAGPQGLWQDDQSQPMTLLALSMPMSVQGSAGTTTSSTGSGTNTGTDSSGTSAGSAGSASASGSGTSTIGTTAGPSSGGGCGMGGAMVGLVLGLGVLRMRRRVQRSRRLIDDEPVLADHGSSR